MSDLLKICAITTGVCLAAYGLSYTDILYDIVNVSGHHPANPAYQAMPYATNTVDTIRLISTLVGVPSTLSTLVLGVNKLSKPKK